MQLLIPLVLLPVAALVVATALSVSPTAPLTTPRTTTGRTTTGRTTAGSGSSPPAATAATPATAATAAFAWPLSPRPLVHRRFEPPLSQWSRGHRGVDLVARSGQPVLSAGAGAVAFSGTVAGRGVITIAHAGGLRTTYEPVDQRLPAGTRVRRGDIIGVVAGSAGHCPPLTYLHWGAIVGHTYQDPLLLLGIGRPILLPLG